MERELRVAGLSMTGVAALIAVVAVLFVVSVPRLRGLVQTENEADARELARLIARRIGDVSETRTIELLTEERVVEKALSDSRFVADGRLLLRHGYVFTIIRLAPEPPPDEPGVVLAGTSPAHLGPAPPRARFAVMAWPYERGRTGRIAWLATAEGALFRHANRGAGWSGIDALPRHGSWDGWRRVP